MIFFYVLVGSLPLTANHFWSDSVGHLTIVKYLGGVCLLYAFSYVLLKKPKIPSWFESWPASWFLIFYLIAVLSYVKKGGNVPWELSPLLSYTSFLFLFFITLSLVDSPKKIDYTLLAGLGSVAFASLYLVREWQKYHGTSPDFRPGWVVGDSNYYSLSAAICLPAGFIFVASKRPLWQRVYCGVCVVITLVGDMLASSRGGFLALAAALIFMVLKSRKWGRNSLIVMALLVPVLLLSPLSPLHRLLHPSTVDVGSIDIRFALWGTALKMIKAHPIVGVGLGNFIASVPKYSGRNAPEGIACNTFLEIPAELGIPALLIFVLMLYSGYRRLEAIRRRIISVPSLQRVDAVIALESTLVAFVVGSLFLSTEYQKTFWLMFFLSLCVSPVRSGVKKAKEQLDIIAVPDASVAQGT